MLGNMKFCKSSTKSSSSKTKSGEKSKEQETEVESDVNIVTPVKKEKKFVPPKFEKAESVILPSSHASKLRQTDGDLKSATKKWRMSSVVSNSAMDDGFDGDFGKKTFFWSVFFCF